MVDLCTVIVNHKIGYLNTLIESIIDTNKIIKNIYIADICSNQYEQNDSINGIKTHKFSVNCRLDYGHALGLHACIDKSDNEYILLNDPDIYFKTDVASLYVGYLDKFNIVGIDAPNKCYGYFPTVSSLMIKRSWLPNTSFLKGRLFLRKRPCLLLKDYQEEQDDVMLDGKYLLQGAIKGEKFPEPEKYFDIGCNLWLWCREKQGLWLSFPDTSWNKPSYSPYHTNLLDYITTPPQPFLVHKTHSFSTNSHLHGSFHQEYLKHKYKLRIT